MPGVSPCRCSFRSLERGRIERLRRPLEQGRRLDIQRVSNVKNAVETDGMSAILDVYVEAAVQVSAVGDLFLRHVSV